MRPKKPETTGEGDLFRARLDQIINLKHELVQLGGKIDASLFANSVLDKMVEKAKKPDGMRAVLTEILTR